jgi:hypothetical protein
VRRELLSKEARKHGRKFCLYNFRLQTLPARFSLDETFDVGENTGAPLVEDYDAKMPYRFTGTLKRLVVVLEPEKLTPEERKAMLDILQCFGATKAS